MQVQEFGSPRDLLIRIEGQGGGDNAEQSVVEKVRLALEDDYDFRRVESVGPTVSGELAFNGTMGVLASLVAMLIYIWFRFEWQFGVGAVIATVHDVTMMVGLYVDLRPGVQPDQHRGDPDHRRLLDQRHRRGLRPRARESAHDTRRCRSRSCSTCR